MATLTATLVHTAPTRKPMLAWLNVLRFLCALEIVGFHWLRANHNLGIFGCPQSPSLVSPYTNPGWGLLGFQLPFLQSCGSGANQILSSAAAVLFGYGWEAVDVFIVISGFALTIGVPEGTSVHFWLQWYFRRLTRVLTQYYAIALPYISLFLVFLHLRTHSSTMERLQNKLAGLAVGDVFSIYLTHIFLLDTSRRQWNVSFFSPAWWFIPTILFAYVCFPAYILACRRLGNRLFLAGTFVITIVSCSLTMKGYLVEHGWYYAVLNGAFSLALGIVAGRIWRDEVHRAVFTERMFQSSTTLLAVALVLVGNLCNWFHSSFPLSSPFSTLGLSMLGAQISFRASRWKVAQEAASVDAYALYLLHQPLATPMAVLIAIIFHSSTAVFGLPIYLTCCYYLARAIPQLEKRIRNLRASRRTSVVAAEPYSGSRLIHKPVCIFVPHCSDMLTDHLPNGDGQIAYGFLRQLALNGHELHVATPRLEVRECLHPNLHLYVLTTKLKGPVGRLEYMFRVRHLFLQLRRHLPFQLLYQTNPVFAGVSLAMAGSGLPIVLGTYVPRGWIDPETISARKGAAGAVLRWGRDKITSLQQQQADLLLLTAPAAFDRLPDQDAVKHKVRWIGHGIDVDAFCPAVDYLSESRLNLEQARPSVLFLARAVLHKGILPLVHAWKLVLAQVPSAILHVAGDGPDLDAMKRLAGELCISDQITFSGRVSRSQAPELYQNHSVYVLPSFDEPYATSVLEAMSCGRPIVLTDRGGTRFMLPQSGGLLIPPNDPAPLAAAIIRLLRNPAERRAMASANRAHVLQSFTWPQIAKVLEGYFSEAIENRF